MRTTWMITGACALLMGAVNAQDKGFISGQASMSTTSVSGSDGSTTSGTFGPVVGYNVNERIVVGLGLTYTGNTVSNKQTFGNLAVDLDDKTSLFTIAPFMRYVKKVDDKFALYGQLGLGIGFGSREAQSATLNGNGVPVVSTATVDVNTFSVSVGPGIGYRIAPRWALTADWGALRFQSASEKADVSGAESVTTNTFGLALTPNAITFALNWLF